MIIFCIYFDFLLITVIQLFYIILLWRIRYRSLIMLCQDKLFMLIVRWYNLFHIHFNRIRFNDLFCTIGKLQITDLRVIDPIIVYKFLMLDILKICRRNYLSIKNKYVTTFIRKTIFCLYHIYHHPPIKLIISNLAPLWYFLIFIFEM